MAFWRERLDGFPTLGLPLDLERGPIFRARLLRLAPGDSELVFTVHHVAFDARSEEIFRAELAAHLGALRAGGPSPLAPLRVQVADFAARLGIRPPQ